MNFKKAQRIANAALFLDERKFEMSDEAQYELEQEDHVMGLHEIAYEMAGDRVHEIYNEE